MAYYRSPKITPDLEQQILGACAAGADMALAASVVGVGRQTLYDHLERKPAFKEQLDRAKDRADLAVVKKLYAEAIGGNVSAMIFWLRNRRRSDWTTSFGDREDDQPPNQSQVVHLRFVRAAEGQAAS